MGYVDKLEHLRTKADFVEFLGALVVDLRRNPDGWENSTLERFLEAAMAWTEDMEGYYINTGQPVPANVSWKVFADILAAAVIYITAMWPKIVGDFLAKSS